jgi:hypothetical protein
MFFKTDRMSNQKKTGFETKLKENFSESSPTNNRIGWYGHILRIN